MRKFLFIRDDDVWKLDRPFREFFDLMLAHDIPVVYGVIPAKLQKTAAVFLKKAKEKNPKLIDIVQHGYAHRNYAPAGEHCYEFGAARSYAQQYRDMARGMQIMRRWFGDLLTPGFIPPYHADDPSTIDALEALKIPLYSSRLKVPRTIKKFIDLPAQIWVNRVDPKGKSSPLDFHKLSIDLASVLASGPVTGLVFRHSLMNMRRDKDTLKAFMKLLLKEMDNGKLRAVLFSDLLKKRKFK